MRSLQINIVPPHSTRVPFQMDHPVDLYRPVTPPALTYVLNVHDIIQSWITIFFFFRNTQVRSVLALRLARLHYLTIYSFLFVCCLKEPDR